MVCKIGLSLVSQRIEGGGGGAHLHPFAISLDSYIIHFNLSTSKYGESNPHLVLVTANPNIRSNDNSTQGRSDPVTF
jgi:hypothetical protein